MNWDNWDRVSGWIYIYSTISGVIIFARGILVGGEETGDWLITSFWGLILLGPMGILLFAHLLLILYVCLIAVVRLIKKIPDKYLNP